MNVWLHRSFGGVLEGNDAVWRDSLGSNAAKLT